MRNGMSMMLVGLFVYSLFAGCFAGLLFFRGMLFKSNSLKDFYCNRLLGKFSSLEQHLMLTSLSFSIALSPTSHFLRYLSFQSFRTSGFLNGLLGQTIVSPVYESPSSLKTVKYGSCPGIGMGSSVRYDNDSVRTLI